MKSKVATIYGGWDTPKLEGEVWGCNTAYKRVRLTKLFVMHMQVYENGVPVFDWDDMDNVCQQKNIEIISLHPNPKLRITRYPINLIMDFFETEYFASSLDYMIAYALHQDYKELRLWGWHFTPTVSDVTDDFWERCGAEYWIGRAQGAGVKIHLSSNCSLLTTRTGKPYAWQG